MASMYEKLISELFRTNLVTVTGYVDAPCLRVAFYREQQKVVESLRSIGGWQEKKLSIRKETVTKEGGEVMLVTHISLVDKAAKPCYNILSTQLTEPSDQKD